MNGTASWAAESSFKAVVLVSLNIRPYVEAVGGMEDGFKNNGQIRMEVHDLDPKDEKYNRQLVTRLGNETGDGVFIAVGPQAMKIVWETISGEDWKKVYTMVLNPEKIISPDESPCGVPLNIPISTQLAIISNTLPSLSRIGLLYNPAYNDGFAEIAAQEALAGGVRLVPLQVTQRNEISQVLSINRPAFDGLWLIPDRTVISESIVRFIIKTAITDHFPVIGYNRFFLESGASLCYILDYPKIGLQTAQLAISLMNQGPCRQEIPAFRVEVNERILRKIGFSVVPPGETAGERREP